MQEYRRWVQEMFRRWNNRICRLIAYDNLNKSSTCSCPQEPVAFKNGKENSSILKGPMKPLYQKNILGSVTVTLSAG